MIKSLQIDLRRPRFIKNFQDVKFDDRHGAKRVNAYGLKSGFESEPLEIPFDLTSVSFVWGGENGVSQHLQGYIRTTNDLSTWPDWMAVESAGSEFSSAYLFESLGVKIPAGDKYLQFRLEFVYGANNEPSVDRVTVNYTNLVAEATLREDKPEQFQSANSSGEKESYLVTQAVSAPRIISRTEWGCPTGQAAPGWEPKGDNTPITHLVVHHTLLGRQPKNPNDYKGWVKNIWEYHQKSTLLGGRGYGDIGYNLLIDPKGNVYEGRAGGVDEKGAHFSCYNSHTTGIALLGDFSAIAPTRQALDALQQVLAWRATTWSIDPKITTILLSPDPTRPLRVIPTIAGHLDINPVTWSCDNNNDDRTCPGTTLYGLLPGIRNNVATMVPPGFSLQVQSNSQQIFVSQGQQVSIGVNLDSYGGLSGTSSISMIGLPPGSSVAPVSVFVPANGNVSGTLILKTTSSTPAGLYSPTILASLGGLPQKSAKVTVTVTAAPGSVTVRALNNGQPWTGQVDYSVVGPQGVIIGLGVPATTNNLAPGQYTLSYKGGGPGSFVNVTPANSQTMLSGGQLTFTLNFSSASPSPLSVNCSTSPAVITVGQSSTFNASASGGMGPYLYTWTGAVSGNTPSITKTFNAAGTFVATVTVSDGSLQGKQATCSVQVNPAPVPGSFDVYTFSSSKTVQAGQTAVFDLFFQPQNGFSGQVTTSVSGLPSGSSMTSSSQVNISGTNPIGYALNIRTSTSTPVGVFPLTFTAISQGITRTVNLSLTTTPPPLQPLSASCTIQPTPITLGQGATVSAQALGGKSPYRYRINGVDMGTVSSLLVMPSQLGTFTVPVTVFDSQNQQASGSCSAQVVAANPYVTGFNYTPNPAKAQQVVNLNIYGGNFIPTTQVWFVGPGCSSPGCQTNAVNVVGTAYIAAQAILNLTGTYTVNIRNGSGVWVKVGTVTVVQ